MHELTVESRPARQGAKLSITPRRGQPWEMHDLPITCTSDWRVSDPAAVDLAPDRGSIAITRDATPGQVVTISYDAFGHRYGTRVTIVARDQVVLDGAWSQSAMTDCQRADRVGELRFDDKGSFAVTFQPFETYHDYWGSYVFDEKSGVLRLTVTGGNFTPPGLDLDGHVTLNADQHLVLTGFDFGGRLPTVRAGKEACRYTF